MPLLFKLQQSKADKLEITGTLDAAMLSLRQMRTKLITKKTIDGKDHTGPGENDNGDEKPYTTSMSNDLMVKTVSPEKVEVVRKSN